MRIDFYEMKEIQRGSQIRNECTLDIYTYSLNISLHDQSVLSIRYSISISN